MILSEIILGYNLFFRSSIAVFMFIINLMCLTLLFYTVLLSAILVPGNSFIMLIYILLFQYYSQNYAGIIGSGLD